MVLTLTSSASDLTDPTPLGGMFLSYSLPYCDEGVSFRLKKLLNILENSLFTGTIKILMARKDLDATTAMSLAASSGWKMKRKPELLGAFRSKWGYGYFLSNFSFSA